MSAIFDKYRRLMPKKIRINHENKTKNIPYKENETDLKVKKIANLLYLDIFHEILITSKVQFIKNTEKKLDKIISDHFPEYMTIKKAYYMNLKKEINYKYINEYALLKNALNNYNKNPKNFQFVTNFTPHCPKCEKYAYHNCTNSLLYGKFIEIKNTKNDFVICIECKMCYNSDLIEMYCKYCKKNYYSSIIEKTKNTVNNNNTQKKLPFATWEKYHCGFIINEIMKCIKCKSNFYYDNINNKLICLNKKCRFEAKPKSIIWKCSICSSEFISSVKAFNPLEIKIYKNAINYALIIREKARPYKVIFCNFCGGDVSKATFYHKKDCGGELLMSKLNNKEVVVCSRCHGMNFYSQYSWLCPFCDRKIKNKNYINIIKSREINNSIKNNNNITKTENAFSHDNEKIINKYSDYKNLKLYKKKNLLKNSFTTITYINLNKNIKKPDTKINNTSLKDESNTYNETNKNAKIPKTNSLFTIKNLFMRNDSDEKYRKTAINFNHNNYLYNSKTVNSKSLEKTIKKKSTLFDILQKRYNERTFSASTDKKGSFKNNLTSNSSNIIINNTNINTNTNTNINNNANINNNIIYNTKKIIPYSFSLKNKFIRNKTEKNISISNFNQNNLIINENPKKNEIIKKIIYQKNVGSKINELNKEKEKEKMQEMKKEKGNHIYKSVKYINNIKEYSLYNREKDNNHLENKLKNKNKIKDKTEKTKIEKPDNKDINKNNDNKININRYKFKERNTINNIGKTEIIRESEDKKPEFNRFFRKSYNKLSISNNNSNYNSMTCNNGILYNSIKDLKKNIQNNTKLLNKNNFFEEERKKRMENVQKPIQIKNDIKKDYSLNYSKTVDNFKENKNKKDKSLEISLKQERESLNDRKKYKTMSKRRYYQNLTKNNSKEKNNQNNIHISYFINNLSISLDNDRKSIKYTETNTNDFSKFNDKYTITNYIKELNIINTNANTNSNTNNDKTNNIKDNESQDENIDLVDFDYDDNNRINESRINSILNREKENPNNILYSPKKFDEIIKSCNIPSFGTTDYIYKIAIGEGSYGTIFEVEEKNTGKKYAIKKIICRDLQQLIKQKEQLEFAYSIQHENIMKIYKAQINCLDFSTYSISVLMELAISDWNQEIINRSINNDYYKEKELICILKQIINGLFFLKNKNIAHRDIKPQNILIFPNNKFKLADFGEAKNINNIISLRTLKGCELYMSPTLYWGLLHGKKNIVHNIYKSDVFSLGYCILYAMTLNIFILQKIRKLNNNIDIRNIIYNSINRNIYSQKFVDIVCNMVNIDEEKRYDFEKLNDEIKKIG